MNTIRQINTLIKTPHFVSLRGSVNRYLEFQEIGPDRVAVHLFGHDNGVVRIGAPILLDLEAEFVGFPTIPDIDWEARQLIGMGASAVVYRVAPGVAVKVGRIAPDEAEAQRYFARRLLALPVWDYRPEWPVPGGISRELCPIHGPRRDILPQGGRGCACDARRHDVLLMPEADSAPIDVNTQEYRAFAMFFSRDCEQQLGRCWDVRPANVAFYQGQMIALDFGEEEAIS